ncbi:cadherin EGF LAG seven-pass G-type receptor 1-like isoform X2 [Sycon ciliatum]|uniref:cadherin EGF LAG seven-pass G-type receptor 1-like isoform X1 n=1 Tax=Sycon ciliatum TaxID=27933 RepID=UPI0031F6E11B
MHGRSSIADYRERCGFVMLQLLLLVLPLASRTSGFVPRDSWKDWGIGLQGIGGRCGRPPQPPESRVTLESVNGATIAKYHCYGDRYIHGPSELRCNQRIGIWMPVGRYYGHGPVCSVCPSGWLGQQNNCYRVIVTSLSQEARMWRVDWLAARSACAQSNNATLAEIPNAETEQLFERLIGGTFAGTPYVVDQYGNRVPRHTAFRGAWVGLSDIGTPGIMTWSFSNRTWTQVGFAPSGLPLTTPALTSPNSRSYCLRLRSVVGNTGWDIADCGAFLSAAICQQQGYVTCGDPITPANGDSTLSNRKQTASFACKLGYRMLGPAEYSCDTRTARWMADGQEVVTNTTMCVAVTCPAPNISEFHLHQVAPRQEETYLFGTRLHFTCKSHLYEPDGSSQGNHSVECLPSGRWSEMVQPCKKTTCTLNLGHGHHVNSTKLSPNTKYALYDSVTFRCRSGYYLDKGSRQLPLTIHCVAENTWSSQPITCKRCKCVEDEHATHCNWMTGECLCKEGNLVEGKDCNLCKANTYRSDDDEPCLDCACNLAGVKTVAGGNPSKCNASTGQCDCKCGCTGRACDVCNLVCPAEDNYTRNLTVRGTLDWPQANPGDTVTRECTYGGVAVRRCVCNATSSSVAWETADTSDCKYNPDPDAALNALLNLVVTEDNAGELSGAMNGVTADSSKIGGTTLDLGAKVVSNIVDVRTSDHKVGEGLMGAISNIAETNLSVLAEGNLLTNASNRMLVLAEEYGATTLLSAGETRVIESDNIASKLTDISPVDLKTLSIGIEDGSSPRARRNTDGNAAAQPAAKISFENVENLAVEGPEENVRVQFSVFKRESLFHRAVDTQPRDAAAANGRDAVTPPNLQLNTAIVSAKLGQGRAEFDGTVRLDFRLKKNGTKPVCVFWDFAKNGGQGGWSREGCHMVVGNGTNNDTFPGEAVVQCHCSHLTHFAMLMDLDPTRQAQGAHLQALSYITYIGCGISMLALLIAIVLLLNFKKLRQPMQMRLLLHLCVAWLFALASFIIGGRVTGHREGCMTMAVLTHYLLLVVFAFTFAQAYYLYSSLVRVYGSLVKKFMWKCVALGWGVPALIVGVTMAATVMDAYEPADSGKVVCLINIAQHKIAFIVTFYVPIGLVLLANVIIFFMVLRRVIKPRPGMTQRDIEDHKRDLKLSVSLALLLGLTWLFGMALVGEVKLVFEYVFTILNAFLGLFVVAMHFGLRKEVHEEVSRSLSQRSTNRSFLSRSSTKNSGGSGGSNGKSLTQDSRHKLTSTSSSNGSMKVGQKFVDSDIAVSSTGPAHSQHEGNGVVDADTKRSPSSGKSVEPPPYSENAPQQDKGTDESPADNPVQFQYADGGSSPELIDAEMGENPSSPQHAGHQHDQAAVRTSSSGATGVQLEDAAPNDIDV